MKKTTQTLKQIIRPAYDIVQTLYSFYHLTKSAIGFPRHYVLPRKFYIDDEIYQAELKEIFYKRWIFAGLTSELDQDRSWVRKKIGLKEILIVKDGGQYSALENICPHKNIRFFDTDKGYGPLVCGYHAWSFNPDGSNKAIPFEIKSYKFNAKQKEMSCMTKYDVSILGSFIFVKLSKNKYRIEDQFDDYIIKSLKLISKMLDKNYKTFKEARPFNWKLNFENLRDALHPAVLHSKTLAKGVDFSAQYEESEPLHKKIGLWVRLKHASSLSKDGENKSKEKGYLDDLATASLGSGYYNWLLFPNFHMATPDGGRSYNIEFLNPISANETEIYHYNIINRLKLKDEETIRILDRRMEEGRPILEEDYWALENIQKALQFTEREQNVGAYEHYNVNIANIYRRLIKR
jgi:phenylpropionate dioxygenase-like ring-hydroxylating dioxygenase large terminal subunit